MLATVSLHAVVLVVPQPGDMLTRAETIVVGTLTKREGTWFLTVKRSLKGSRFALEVVRLSTSLPPQAFRLDDFGNHIGSNEFLFVGRESRTSNAIVPVFGHSSAWPQGTDPEFLPARTLEDCVIYAEEVLNKRPLKTAARQEQMLGSKSPPGFESAQADAPASTHVRPTPHVHLQHRTKLGPQAPQVAVATKRGPSELLVVAAIIMMIAASLVGKRRRAKP